MAVPGTGSLSLGGLAFEKLEDEYAQGLPALIDSSYGPFSLRDITEGGGVYGGGEDYDITNGFSPSHPDNVAAFGMSEFYSYDHDYAAPACNIAYQTGGVGTFDFPINLGSATGTVTIEYQAYSVPDKFVFTWNGNTYTSGSGNGTGSGFVGSSNFASNSYVQPLTTLTGVYGGTTGPQGQNGGRGTITFNKNSSTSSSNMRISAPLSGTGWWFSVSCPGMQVIGGGDGIAPSITASIIAVATTSIGMRGNVSSKGFTSNFTTTGTISEKGFVYLPGVTTSSNFYRETPSGTFTADVVEVLEDDSTINTTGDYTESTATISSGTATLTTANASAITASNFVANYTPTSVGARPVSFRAFAKNSAGTTYSSIVNTSTQGYVDQLGITYCNGGYSQTPIVNMNAGSIVDATGNDYQQDNTHGGTSTSARTQTIVEGSVSLTSNNTYRYRAVARQGSNIIYGNVVGFTVPASYSFSATLTTGTAQYYSTVVNGWSNSYPFSCGSISNTSFNGATLTALYWMNSSSGTDYLYIYFSSTKPSFTNIVINGTSYGASSTWTSASSTVWKKPQSSNIFGSNGTTNSINASY